MATTANVTHSGSGCTLPFKRVVTADHEAMSQWAADAVLGRLQRTPTLLIGAATGSTPARTYELLAQRGQREPAQWAHARILKLDEWGGLAMDDPATCEVCLREQLLSPLGIAPDRCIGWNSQPPDPEAECLRMARLLDEHGPIGLCILGLGANGHLALNEPAEALRPGPHVVALTAESLMHPMLNVARKRPDFGLTLGIGDLLRSGEILLLVSGRHKARQLRQLLEPRISPAFPASVLWLRDRVTIVCDRDAASLLEES